MDDIAFFDSSGCKYRGGIWSDAGLPTGRQENPSGNWKQNVSNSSAATFDRQKSFASSFEREISAPICSAAAIEVNESHGDSTKSQLRQKNQYSGYIIIR